MKNQDNLKNRRQPKTNFFRKTLQNTSFLRQTVWRGVRDLNPRGPTGHRLSRPAPYQARVTPLGYT